MISNLCFWIFVCVLLLSVAIMHSISVLNFIFLGGKIKQSFVHFRIEPVIRALGGAGSFRHQQIWERYLL